MRNKRTDEQKGIGNVLTGVDYIKSNTLDIADLQSRGSSLKADQSPVTSEADEESFSAPVFESARIHTEGVLAEAGFLRWFSGYLARHRWLAIGNMAIFCSLVVLGLSRENIGFVSLSAVVAALFILCPAFVLVFEYVRFLLRRCLNSVNSASEASEAGISQILEADRSESRRGLGEVDKRVCDLDRTLRNDRESLRGIMQMRLDAIGERLNALQFQFRQELVAERERQSFLLLSSVEERIASLATLHGESIASLKSELGHVMAKLAENEDEARVQLELAEQKLVGELSRSRERELELEKALETSVKEIRSEIAAFLGFRKRTDKIVNHLNSTNSAFSQVHQRFLPGNHVDRFLEYWLPVFGLDMTKRGLYYLAHRICLIEDRLDGRLATTVSAALMRLLALRSIKSRSINVLEIGTLFGISACILKALGSTEHGRINITVIDPLTGYYGKGSLDPQTGVPIDKATLTANFRRMGFRKTDYNIIESFSQDPAAAEEASQKSYDYIILDGDHSYNGLAEDFAIYSKMLKIGGLMIFDDYATPEWPDIKRVVDDRVIGDERWEFLGGEFRTAIFRLKKGLS